MFLFRKPEKPQDSQTKLAGEPEVALRDLFHQAQNNVRLLSPRLEHRVFAPVKTIEEANLFLCTKNTSMQLIVYEDHYKKFLSHAFMETITKHRNAEIRLAPEGTLDTIGDFMLVDQNKFYFYPNGGIPIISENPEPLIKLDTIFDTMWKTSKPLQAPLFKHYV